MKLFRNFRGRHSGQAHSVIDPHNDRTGLSFDFMGPNVLRRHSCLDIVPGMAMKKIAQAVPQPTPESSS
jgi:hypothetical protein